MKSLKREKIIVGVLLLAGILMLSASTIAYFSVAQTSENLFAVGNISMQVDNEPVWTGTFSADLSGMMPGDQGWGNVTLSNHGTATIAAWVSVGDVVTAGDAPNDVDTMVNYTVVKGGVVEVPGDVTIPTVNGTYVYLGEIAASGSLTVDQGFTLSPDTGEDYMNDSMTFSVTFIGAQVEAPAPAPELSGHGR